MKNLYVLLLVASACLWSCNTPANQEKAQEKKAVTTKGQESQSTNDVILLNPNRATLKQLSAIDGIEDSVATILIENKPYLNMTQFHNQLKTLIADDLELEIMYNQVFVPINLNTAEESEFKLVPGVGDKMAHEFEEYRPYQKIDQFRREIGKYVDESEVSRYEKFVFVPLDINSATDKELLSIPGVGDKMLHEFKEYRPYESIEQFRREIGKYVTEEEVALYERYLQIIR